MLLADVHAHMDILQEKEIVEAIKKAEKIGIKAIINNGVNKETNRKTLELANKYPLIKSALGIYPIECQSLTEEEIETELQFIKKSKIAAIGEIGLDYQQTQDREKQQKVFEKQIELGIELEKPIIVHSRKAEKEVVETLINKKSIYVILHAFHGNMKLVKQAADAGFYFSIPSNIGRSHHFQKLVETVSMSRLLTETDAPYLGPVVGEKSEPTNCEITIKKIAEIKRMTPIETALIIFRNYQTLFK